MLEKLTQEQFNHIIDVLILYNKLTPDDVYLNESSIKKAFIFMNTQGKQFADQLGIN